MNNGLKAYAGYKIERNASKSLRSMLLNDMVIGRLRGPGCRAGQIGWRSALNPEKRNTDEHSRVFHQPINNLTNEFGVYAPIMAETHAPER